MHHFSLKSGSVKELYALKKKLEDSGVDVSTVIDHFFLQVDLFS